VHDGNPDGPKEENMARLDDVLDIESKDEKENDDNKVQA
jgi:hypothetical protein